MWILTSVLVGAIAINSMLVLLEFWNWRTLRRLPTGEPLTTPLVSVLIPCRNEEETVGGCLQSVLGQDYRNLQIVTLDDNSTDGTLAKLKEYSERDGRIEVCKGEQLPEDWTGKNWACHQLSERASGDIFLFVDADSTLDAHAVRDGVSAMEREGLEFITVFPDKTGGNITDRAMWAMVSWTLMSWLPLWIAHRFRFSLLTAGFGQYLMLSKEGYLRCGGHKMIHSSQVDDMEIARSAKSSGLSWRLYEGSGRVASKGYETFNNTVQGYGKVMFSVFRYNLPIFTLAWVTLAVTIWLPLAVLGLGLLGSALFLSLSWVAGAAAGFMLLSWLIPSRRLKFHPIFALMYPAVMVLVLYIALRSMWGAYGGGLEWKGRELKRRV